MFCQCSVTVTMFRNNVSVICYMLVTDYNYAPWTLEKYHVINAQYYYYYYPQVKQDAK